MKIWSCVGGVTQQTWYYTGDDRIALMNQGSLHIFVANRTKDSLDNVRPLPRPYERLQERRHRHADLGLHLRRQQPGLDPLVNGLRTLRDLARHSRQFNGLL